MTEIIFSIDAVNKFFCEFIKQAQGWSVFLTIFLIMFAQVTILNIPAYSILTAIVGMGIKVWSWEFLVTTISAYMCGCLLAYWLGRWFGTKAVKWCAGSQEDFDKWSCVLNKKGKWWYLATVVFPFFPDDLLCLVAGAVKFDVWFFTFSNLIGRTIGLCTTLATLQIVRHSNFPFMIIVWCLALIGEFVVYVLLKRNRT